MDCKTFILLYKALVRPHVEYANSVWSPYKKSDIEQIEKNSEKSYQTRYYLTKVVIQRPFDIFKVAYTKIQKIAW